MRCASTSLLSLHRESTKSSGLKLSSFSTHKSGAVTVDADLIEQDLPIVIAALNCIGSENNITSCAYTTAENVDNCDNAYVICQGMSQPQI